ncbi:hypothetical protein CEXT_574641 [Caerostris extrusa]|uniref:Uncharacterized protein n=1 Tax=Caerostris extrusa TaxID=172846 RepID=A0AAV4P659_CAEEX|nr:hypothetical protein CEXT_574641 [Caerostris extrusa]
MKSTLGKLNLKSSSPDTHIAPVDIYCLMEQPVEACSHLNPIQWCASKLAFPCDPYTHIALFPEIQLLLVQQLHDKQIYKQESTGIRPQGSKLNSDRIRTSILI